MAQVTIYLDNETLESAKKAADIQGTSLSKWVKQGIHQSLKEGYPDGYFELFGSLEGQGLERPEQPNPSDEAERVSL